MRPLTKFLRVQYLLGKLTKEQLDSLINKKITPEEEEEIIK